MNLVKVCNLAIILLMLGQITSISAIENKGEETITSVLPVGSDVIDFVLPEFFTGIPFTLSNISSGKVVMLDLMASWCGPCKEAMPEIRQLYHTFYPGGKFDIISIGVDDKAGDPDKDMRDFYYTYGIEWYYARDQQNAINGTSSVWNIYGTGLIPTMYLLFEGKVVYQEVGFSGYSVIKKEILKYIPADTVNPTILSSTNKTNNLSIINPSVDVFVDAVDNWRIESVTALFSEKSISLARDINGKWIGTVTFDPIDLYNKSTVSITYVANDYFGNQQSVTHDLNVTFVQDSEPPLIINLDKPVYYETDKLNLVIKASVVDNIQVKRVEIIEKFNGNEKRYLMNEGLSGNYKFIGRYPLGTDLNLYEFKLNAIDVAENNVTVKILLDLPVENTTTTTTITDTITSKETSSSTSVIPSETTGSVISSNSTIEATTNSQVDTSTISTTEATEFYSFMVIISLFSILFFRKKRK